MTLNDETNDCTIFSNSISASISEHFSIDEKFASIATPCANAATPISAASQPASFRPVVMVCVCSCRAFLRLSSVALRFAFLSRCATNTMHVLIASEPIARGRAFLSMLSGCTLVIRKSVCLYARTIASHPRSEL